MRFEMIYRSVGRTGGRTDGRADRGADGQTGGPTGGGRAGGRRAAGRTARRTDRWANRQSIMEAFFRKPRYVWALEASTWAQKEEPTRAQGRGPTTEIQEYNIHAYIG